MGQSLTEIAQQLRDANKKVQLIYAFNGTGKTRLSREFKQLLAPTPEADDNDDTETTEPSASNVLYYNAFTEDLFYWDNDLSEDSNPKLKIQPNTFTSWLIKLLKELGEDGNIVTNFQRYTGSKATPIFNEEYRENKDTIIPELSEISFQLETSNPVAPDKSNTIIEDDIISVQGQYDIIKVSKGEESSFVWSFIYSLLEQVISTLNEPENTNRITNEFDNLEYVFIDDPVSSLDDKHLIEQAVDLASLIKRSAYLEGNGLKFIITTHNPLFYNVLSNELNNDLKNPIPNGTPSWLYKRKHSKTYRLDKKLDGEFELSPSNDHPFSYHLFLLKEIQNAIDTNSVKKYHFSFLRNILEKTSTFLGYRHWEELLEKEDNGSPNVLLNRMINLANHSAHSGEEIADIDDKDKKIVKDLMDYLTKTYGFKIQDSENG